MPFCFIAHFVLELISCQETLWKLFWGEIGLPYPNEHACRLKDPDTLDIVGSEERKHGEKTYRVIFGKPKDDKDAGSVEQAYRYPKDSWDVDDARNHCADHDGSFEAASDNVKEGHTLLLFGAQPTLKNGKISGRAIHPVTTMHNEFPVLREFVAEHLEKAINDSAFPIPINVDHGLPLDFTKNRITELRWNPETMEVEYSGEVEDRVEEDIKNGLYKNGVSIEIGFPPGSSIEFVNGSTAIARAVPRGFQYKAVSLLRDMSPSDPTTTLRAWNNAVEALQSQNQGDRMEENKAIAKPSEVQLGGLQTFREYGKQLKQQGLTKEEILAKIAELEKQHQEIMDQLYPEAELTEEQRNELNVKSEQLWTEIDAYREALAALTVEEVLDVVKPKPAQEKPIAPATVNEGENQEVKEEEDSSQPKPEKKPESQDSGDEESDKGNGDEESPKPEDKPESAPEEEKKKNVVGEAILGAGDSLQPTFVVSVEKLESVMPSLQAERSMSYGAQRFVQDIKGLIREAKEAPRSG
jgi:hypothetical protein